MKAGVAEDKGHETGVFAITGFEELGAGRLEAICVAEERAGQLVPAGRVPLSLAGKGRSAVFDQLRAGPARRDIVPMRLGLMARCNSLAGSVASSGRRLLSLLKWALKWARYFSS